MTESSTSNPTVPADFDSFRPLEKLTFIATGDKKYPDGPDGLPPLNPPTITVEKYKEWKPQIDELVSAFRAEYTNSDRHGEEVRRYYAPCWADFDKAKTDEEIAEAVNYLIGSIRWE